MLMNTFEEKKQRKQQQKLARLQQMIEMSPSLDEPGFTSLLPEVTRLSMDAGMPELIEAFKAGYSEKGEVSDLYQKMNEQAREEQLQAAASIGTTGAGPVGMMAGYTPDLGAESIMKGVMAKEPPGENVKHTAAYQALMDARQYMEPEVWERSMLRQFGEIPTAGAELQAEVTREGYAVRRGDQAIARDRLEGEGDEATEELTKSQRGSLVKEHGKAIKEEFKGFGVRSLTPTENQKATALLRDGPEGAAERYILDVLLSPASVLNKAATLSYNAAKLERDRADGDKPLPSPASFRRVIKRRIQELVSGGMDEALARAQVFRAIAQERNQ
jgi:hypothetical protein